MAAPASAKDRKFIIIKREEDEVKPIKVKIPNDLAKLLEVKSVVDFELTQNMLNYEFEKPIHADKVKQCKDTIIRYLRTSEEDLDGRFELSMVADEDAIYFSQDDIVFETNGNEPGDAPVDDDVLVVNVDDEYISGLLTRESMHNDATLECKVTLILDDEY